ncbi:hypothetical protein CPBP_00268 [Candidatus Bodocaedibacter vickermanii]|uniref:Uncharacterized protein n=2 Tax=Candidatus Bodocaedibacter vickermanii TaxID=2741701 RepID=A0A7L9RSJ2_9PROT|nr:hypothetical protein CPBP_00268 [Candidatus Paracaedibacteraceae bacterium 'Lake Konstanz']
MIQKIYKYLSASAIIKMAITLVGLGGSEKILGGFSNNLMILTIVSWVILVFKKPFASLVGRIIGLSYKDAHATLLPDQQKPPEFKLLEPGLNASKDNIFEEEDGLEKGMKSNSTASEQFHDKGGEVSQESEVTPIENLDSQFVKPEEYYDGVNWIVKNKDQHIREFLERKYQKSDVDGAKSTSFIIENLAKAYVDIDFFKLKCLIVPEQLEFLKTLNKGSLTVGYVKNYHSVEVLQRYQATETQYPFGSFIDWLCDSGLIEEKGGYYQITNYGHSFLVFLVENRLP